MLQHLSTIAVTVVNSICNVQYIHVLKLIVADEL